MNLLLTLPALLLLALVFAVPLLRYGWLSFHADSVITGLQPVPNGGANWLRLIEDERFWQNTVQTLRFAGLSVALELLLGLALALLLHQSWRGRTAVRTITLLPWALPTAVMALGWRWIFNDPYGPINALVQALGQPALPFLSSPASTWFVVVLADVWKTTPFVALLLLAGLQSIPPIWWRRSPWRRHPLADPAPSHPAPADALSSFWPCCSAWPRPWGCST
jgi:multiple sugar transport system permease protein